ncbi:MAG: FAD-dependent oxidoreductase [Novosphingobium sp.]|nr:FAD-dependent oxidoreductase [Novosphingobium sp.]
MNGEYDVVVIGSGAGGLLAALRAAENGLSVVVLEKAALYGGTTATSGGAIWVPCHGLGDHEDSREQAESYLNHVTGGEAHGERLTAYLDHAPEMVGWMQSLGIGWDMLEGYPDYFTEAPGTVPGRALAPAEVDGKLLGEDYLNMRLPFGAFMLLGRYSMGLDQAFSLSARLPGWQRVAAGIFAKYWLDPLWRLRTKRDRRATMGNAAIAALRLALKQRGVPVMLETPLRRIEAQDGRVTGVEVEREGALARIGVGKGLVLAAGGFEQSQHLRDENLPVSTSAEWSLTPRSGNTGDALIAADALGADREFMANCWWAPSTMLPSFDDPEDIQPQQMFFDHRHPHSLVVNGLGERFLNESCSYDEFGKAMIADQQRTGANLPCWLIFDATYRDKYGCGSIMPGSIMPDRRIPAHFWDRWFYRAPSLAELADKIGLPVDALEASVAQMNKAVAADRDEAFGRGASAYDRFFGDQSVAPNPSMGPVAAPPFYAIRIELGDLGTKGGLKVDGDARVISTSGEAIEGLYAVGNCAASPFANCYPGSGGTIGPAMVFGYVAADHIAGTSGSA